MAVSDVLFEFSPAAERMLTMLVGYGHLILRVEFAKRAT